MDVNGKAALVTGGSSGIGRETALTLARAGARVAVADIDADKGAETVAALEGIGTEALFISLDVTDEASWRQAVEAAVGRFGRLDVLVNAAGIELVRMIHETSLDDFRRVMSVNLDGVFLGTKYGIAAMSKTGGGSIINISSIAGIRGYGRQTAYCASKGGVRLLTKAAAVEAAQNGLNVRVNSVHPGVIDTAMTRGMFGDRGDDAHQQRWEKLADLAPIGRVGEPSDIANMILYLASDASSFVTGAEMVVDGGITATG